MCAGENAFDLKWSRRRFRRSSHLLFIAKSYIITVQNDVICCQDHCLDCCLNETAYVSNNFKEMQICKIPNEFFYAQLKLPVSEVFQFFLKNIIPVITCSTTVASFCIVKILPALWSGLWEPGSANQLLVGNFLVVHLARSRTSKSAVAEGT